MEDRENDMIYILKSTQPFNLTNSMWYIGISDADEIHDVTYSVIELKNVGNKSEYVEQIKYSLEYRNIFAI